MKPVTAEIEVLAVRKKASGIPSIDRPTFKKGHLSAVGTSQLVCRAYTGRSPAEDHQPRFPHRGPRFPSASAARSETACWGKGHVPLGLSSRVRKNAVSAASQSHCIQVLMSADTSIHTVPLDRSCPTQGPS